jgi:hypothetical protein
MKQKQQIKPYVISGFRREVDDNCAVLGYYVAISGHSLPTVTAPYSVHSDTELL